MYNPEQDKFIYLVTEIGDLGTIMLRDENFIYKHNKKLINHLILNNKHINIHSENEMYIKPKIEDDEYLINQNNLKYEIKKFLAKILFKQIAIGLIHLHKTFISHRDIKPDNIVFSSRDDNIKIIDFSISVFFKELNNINKDLDLGKAKGLFLTNEPGGTIHFQAPEQFETGKHNPFFSDIWSLGVSLYIFICEEYPFDSESELELQIKIFEEDIKFPEFVDNNMKNIIQSMLERDLSKRISSIVTNFEFVFL